MIIEPLFYSIDISTINYTYTDSYISGYSFSIYINVYVFPNI